jgi:hypothetical protein
MSDPSIDILSRFIKELLSGVLEAADGADVRAVFVGGSVAGGEAACRVNGSSVEIYSDVDLYVVVGDSADLEDVKSRCRAAGGNVPLRGDGFVFYRAPDVGVYKFEDLASQPARPGTVGLGTRHMMLYGEKDIPENAARRIGNNISPGESLYLLENRLLEMSVLQSRAGEKDSIDAGYASFVACKTCLDVVAATLIVSGQFEAGRSDQLRRLRAMAMDEDIGWSDAQLEFAGLCDTALHKMPAPGWAESVPFELTAGAAIALALNVWKRIAAGFEKNWSSTLMRRCRNGEYLRNFRQFRALNTRCGFKQRGAMVSGAKLSRYSPVDVLRMSALIHYLNDNDSNQPEIEHVMQSVGPYLDRLTSHCGFDNGRLLARSAEMYMNL